MIGIDRSDSFVYLLERIIARLSGWKEKLLSMGEKEILIKAVLQAIPVFAMAVFKIPKKLIKELTHAIAGFWWGIQKYKRRCIGVRGGECAFLRRRMVWGLGIYTPLIEQC
jgi:hypothetical protein